MFMMNFRSFYPLLSVHPLLELRVWHFVSELQLEPGLVEGQPYPVWIDFPVKFNLVE